MKLDRKKYLILGVIAFFIILGICFLVNNNPENKIKNDHTFDVGGNVAREDMQPLNQTTNLNNLLSNIKYKVSKDLKGVNDDEANKLLDLGIYEGLEKRVAISDSENKYTEIWLLKTSEERQGEKIFEYFEKRIKNLESSSNKNVEELFADSKNIIMKVQDNIAIIILSKNAPEIEKIIDQEMSENGSKVININATASVSTNLTTEDKVTVKLENANENLNVNYLIFDSHDGADYENNERGYASGEIAYNEETKIYEKEIDLSEVTSDKVYLQVIAYDENQNMKEYRLGEVVVAKDGIVEVRTERKADGNIAVNVEAVEGGEICITTENVYPDDNANWQKYEKGKEYIYEDDNNSVREIYVYYKSSTVVTSPGEFSSVGSVSWVTNKTYAKYDEYASYTYIKDSTGKYAKIISCMVRQGEVIFPTYIDGLRVLSIGNLDTKCNIFGASNAYKDVTLMQLPKGLEEIGERAFYYCSGLTGNLEIPEGVTSIGQYAFYNCSGLTGNLEIPEGVTSIRDYAFYGCSNLNGNLKISKNVTNIGQHAFQNCSGLTGNLEIPAVVTSIGQYAFSYCSGLTGNLKIPEGITRIEDYVFNGCRGFNETLIIPNTVTSIGSSTFQACRGFNGTLIIPNTVTSIGNYAFSGCTGFSGTLTIPNAVTNIGNYAFDGCAGFSGTLTIPNAVTSIGNCAFNGCNRLTGEIVIPEKVINIGIAPFRSTSIKNITVNNANKAYTIIDEALCTIDGKKLIEVPPKIVITNYKIPVGVTSIGDSAFYNCSGLTGNLEISEGVTSIGQYAFYNCSGLTGNLIIPPGVISIGMHAFSGCRGLMGNLVIPEGIKDLESDVFKDCNNLTGSLVIPESVTRIGMWTFRDCNSLTGKLIIPQNVIFINENAFTGCSGLEFILVTRTESITKLGSSLGIGATNNLFALTQDIADLYNTDQNWKKENYGDGVYPVLQVKQKKSIIIKGDNFEDTGGITLAGLTETSNDMFKTIKTYQKVGETISSSTLNTNNVGVYTATYTLQMLNEATGKYENVKGLNGQIETVSRTIEVIEGDKRIETFEPVGSVNWVTNETYTYNDDYGTFTYIKDSTNKYAKITLCIPKEEVLIFPTYINTLRVLSIENLDTSYNIFGKNSSSINVTSMQLPKGLKEVGKNAFHNCSSLTGNLDIPMGVTSIGDSAFSLCREFIGTLKLPNTVTNIGNSAFASCSGLAGNLEIPAGVISIGNDAFSDCTGFVGTLKLPNTVTQIGKQAFKGCSGLTGNIEIPAGVTSIGSAPFINTGIKNITVNNANKSYKIIDEALCTIDGKNLIEVPPKIVRINYKTPAGVTSIGDSAFQGCVGLIGNLIISAEVTSIGDSAFKSCTGLTGNLVIPEKVTSIKNYVFDGCSGFNGTLTIPAGVTSIGSSAFDGCSGLTGNLVIPIGVTGIGSSAFEGCSGLTGNLVIPEKVTSIGYATFQDCSGFNGTLTIPVGVRSIGSSAFEGCSGLIGNLVIPAGVTSIGSSAFEGCSRLTGNLVIPEKITNIENFVFSGCSGLTGNLVIPKKVTNIGNEAFYGCNGLTGNLVIPENVTSIGYYAFNGCTRLDYILLERKESVPRNGNNSYHGIYNHKKLYALTQDLANKYNVAQYWDEENNGDGVYPVLRKALTTEYVAQGTNFVDKGFTTAGFVEDPNGLFKVLKSYQKEGSSVSSDTLDTSTQGVYTATYTLQMKNASGVYETVYDLSNNPEQVTRTIKVVEEEPYVTDIKVISPVNGEYTGGTKITFNVVWNYAPNVTVAPELRYKFGEEGKEKLATYVDTIDNISTYTCTIENGDEGILTLVAYEAGIVNDNYARSWISSEVTLDEEITAESAYYKDNENNLYQTLKDAFNNAKTGSTITVLRNVEDNELATVTADKTFTLDLNGKTITGSKEMTNFITVQGKLTIKDNSTGEEGAINTSNVKYALLCDGTGSLTIEKGTITGGTDYAISFADKATGNLTINGGTITGSNTAIGNNEEETANVHITIAGGKVEGLVSNGISYYGNGEIRVTGGEVLGDSRGIYVAEGNSLKIIVTEGTITGKTGQRNKHI